MLKRYFIFGIMSIFTVVLLVILYGVYLNYTGDLLIKEKTENQRAPVRVESVTYRDIRKENKYYNMQFTANTVGDVVALNSGIIKDYYVYKLDYIKQGQVVAELIAPELSGQLTDAEAGVAMAKSALARAESNYNRYKRLYERQAASLDNLEEARKNYESAIFSVNSAAAKQEQINVRLSNLKVISNASGKVMLTYHDAGDFVSEGTPIVMVGDESLLYCQVDMDDDEAAGLKPGDEFTVIVSSNQLNKQSRALYENTNKPIREIYLPAKIISMSPAADISSSIRNVRFEVDNSSNVLEARAYPLVSLKFNQKKRCLSVHSGSIRFDTYNNAYVFVVDENGEVHKRRVEVGISEEIAEDNGNDVRTDKVVEIVSGLSDGDKVICDIDYAEGIEDGMKVSEMRSKG